MEEGGVLTRWGHLDANTHTRRMSGRDCSDAVINQGKVGGRLGSHSLLWRRQRECGPATLRAQASSPHNY